MWVVQKIFYSTSFIFELKKVLNFKKVQIILHKTYIEIFRSFHKKLLNYPSVSIPI